MKIVQPNIKQISEINGEEALLRIQRIAKTCYKSYSDKDDVESAKGLIRGLLASGHHSLLENYIITMNYVSNIAAYKDLTRHKVGITFAIESTRWCNYSKNKYDGEIRFLDPIEIPKDSEKYKIWLKAMEQAEYEYLKMAKLGAVPDELSLLLPQSTAAEFNITANLRAWRHLFDQRLLDSTGHARPCIHQIMEPTLELFHEKIPVVFDDQWDILQAEKANRAIEAEKAKQLSLFNKEQGK